jgi:Flp pilus assembly protein TadD
MACAVLIMAVSPLPAAAQPSVAAPNAQAQQSREALELNAALSRLSRDPRNVDALTDAGIAASQLGDFEAAEGFFKRGQTISPRNPRLLTGLAGALVRQGNAAAAIPVFEQALAAGAPVELLASDRGLAHDLVGDTANAQRFYAQAIAANPENDEAILRLAISQAITGDGAAMEKTLLPLLRKQEKPAWRARAFGLAMLGQTKESVNIVKTMLPSQLADGVTPYLQYMPRLTPAQKAAAANLGIFPRASEIGSDPTRLAGLSSAPGARDAGKSLVPAGRPLGRDGGGASDSSQSSRQQARAAAAQARREAKAAEDAARREARLAQAASRAQRVAPPEPRPAVEAGPPREPQFSLASPAAVPPVAAILDGRQTPAPAPPPASAAPVAAAIASAPPAQTARVAAPSAPPPAATVPAPGFDLARLPTSAAPAPTAAAQSAPPPAQPAPLAAEARPSFGALFADLGKPSTSAAPAAGAVDIRAIQPARAKPKPAPEAAKPPPPPRHPSRIWVQLGIGQKIPALTTDWRRREKADPQVFKGRTPFTARLNQTNRLLVGPFASQKEASSFIAELKKAGISGPYIWTSPAGEVVDELPR